MWQYQSEVTPVLLLIPEVFKALGPLEIVGGVHLGYHQLPDDLCAVVVSCNEAPECASLLLGEVCPLTQLGSHVQPLVEVRLVLQQVLLLGFLVQNGVHLLGEGDLDDGQYHLDWICE